MSNNLQNKTLVRQNFGFKEAASVINEMDAICLRLTFLNDPLRMSTDLLDSKSLRFFDIIPGALLNLTVWREWQNLVEAVIENDVPKVISNGVLANSKYTDSNTECMLPKVRENWFIDRGNNALFTACHRGHYALAARLIRGGISPKVQTAQGRNALHAAASQGHATLIPLLLESGADAAVQDIYKNTALAIARINGYKDCERILFTYQWQNRVNKSQKYVDSTPLFAHQLCDSAKPTWFRGRHGTVYPSQLRPQSEFSGSRFSSPLIKKVEPRKYDKRSSNFKSKRVSLDKQISVESEPTTAEASSQLPQLNPKEAFLYRDWSWLRDIKKPMKSAIGV